jgi:uncharacterized membrane protein
MRGLVMIIMALDHVRMYFGYGTWYAEPTNLATTTPLLFFTRWITHFCAPVFVFLAGTSAFLHGTRNATIKETAGYLFIRGIWLILVEVVIVTFAWTFDVTYTFIVLQVIWAIGVSMVVLSALVFLPNWFVLAVGIAFVFGHNLLDSVSVQGTSGWSFLWSALHQPNVFFGGTTIVNLVYPVLPWIGLMALGYSTGVLYTKDFSWGTRRRLLLFIGAVVLLVFLVLRGFNLYGEPRPWREQESLIFTVMSFLNTTKYPASLHFLLMTMGPTLIFLSAFETAKHSLTKPFLVFGKVPFFFYIVHLYVVHALAILMLVYKGRSWDEYILSAQAISSGSLSRFGLGLEAVYLIWILVIVLLYPLCRWYQKYKESHPSKWWLSYL